MACNTASVIVLSNLMIVKLVSTLSHDNLVCEPSLSSVWICQ